MDREAWCAAIHDSEDYSTFQALSYLQKGY